jgi:hypothetical protein
MSKTSMNIPDDLLEELRSEAFHSGLPMQEILCEALVLRLRMPDKEKLGGKLSQLGWARYPRALRRVPRTGLAAQKAAAARAREALTQRQHQRETGAAREVAGQ